MIVAILRSVMDRRNVEFFMNPALINTAIFGLAGASIEEIANFQENRLNICQHLRRGRI